MNQKPEIPGDDDRLKRHPARRPSELEVDRKLKPDMTGAQDHETSPRNVGRHQAPRVPQKTRPGEGRRAA